MRIRVTRKLTARRILGNGTSVLSFKPGDYEVGPEIPQDVANDAIERGDAVELPVKGQRETKPAAKRQTKRRAKVA